MKTRRTVITSTIGYMCFALTGWMLLMPNAGWYHESVYPHSQSLLYPLAILIAVMGILAYVADDTLDAIVFFGGAGLMWAQYLLERSHLMEPSSFAGWYSLVWAVFFCYVWLASFKAGGGRVLFLLGLWLTLLAFAISGWMHNNHFFDVLAGYIGLATSVLAAFVSATSVIGHASPPETA
ncbi:MAG: hypothetical protein ACREFX_04080 [Opitutaceae bacterium]